MGTQITGGIDTHLDVHVAAALDDHGGLLGTASFATTPDGYRELAGWLASFGEVVVVGVEGTGSYGAGLTRHLHAQGVRVVEVDLPNRQRRRRAGKSDTHDAVSAARAAFAGDALGAPKTRDGNVEAIRVLRIARTSARRDRTRALNQMRSLVTTAPDELRSQLRNLTIPKLVHTAAGFRPAGRTDAGGASRLALKVVRRVDEAVVTKACLNARTHWVEPDAVGRIRRSDDANQRRNGADLARVRRIARRRPLIDVRQELARDRASSASASRIWRGYRASQVRCGLCRRMGGVA